LIAREMAFFHHPAFQSLVLPVLLAAAGVGVVRGMLGAAGVRWAPAAAVLALLLALAVLPGFEWPTRAAAQKLPWIILAAWLLALGLESLHAGRWVHALAGSALWLGAGWWLQAAAASAAPRSLVVGAAGIAVLIALMLSTWRPHDAGRAGASARPASFGISTGGGAAGAAMLAVVALGLAGLAVGAGSLLLAQLAVMLAAVTAGLGLWLWPRPRVGFGPVVAMPLGIAWLVIAQATLQLTALSPAVLAVLALAFAAAPLLARVSLPGRRAWVEPCLVAALAALPAALAIAWQVAAGPGADTPGAADSDDPFYELRRR